MGAEEKVTGWFDRLMAINAELFADGHFEAAYHALMAALHLAEDAEQEERLLEVSRVAERQRDHIDGLKPPHVLSSESARSRGHDSVYALAVRQATVRARIVDHARKRHEAPYP